ncbi:hypothetical protein LSH36_31g01000, partial [Paralvinella palmiformis]
EFEDEDIQLTAAQFKHMLITEAIGTLYGSVYVLYFNEATREAIIRVKTSDYQKIWAAVTLLGYYNRHRCAVRVIKVSGHLLGINHTRYSETYTDLIAD